MVTAPFLTGPTGRTSTNLLPDVISFSEWTGARQVSFGSLGEKTNLFGSAAQGKNYRGTSLTNENVMFVF